LERRQATMRPSALWERNQDVVLFEGEFSQRERERQSERESKRERQRERERK